LKIIKKVLIGSELIKAEECDEADNNWYLDDMINFRR
jgi:hypothetical protein